MNERELLDRVARSIREKALENAQRHETKAWKWYLRAVRNG